MRAADLDDMSPFLGLGSKNPLQAQQRRLQLPLGGEHGGDMHGRREAVVGRLAHVDMIVGMDRRLPAARAGQHLVGAPGNDLVDVHVGLGAAAGLPDNERELLVELAGGDLGRSGLDGVGDLAIKAVLAVHSRRSAASR